MWRSGPDGAKSLCNACGVRNRRSAKMPQPTTVEAPAAEPSDRTHVEPPNVEPRVVDTPHAPSPADPPPPTNANAKSGAAPAVPLNETREEPDDVIVLESDTDDDVPFTHQDDEDARVEAPVIPSQEIMEKATRVENAMLRELLEKSACPSAVTRPGARPEPEGAGAGAGAALDTPAADPTLVILTKKITPGTVNGTRCARGIAKRGGEGKNSDPRGALLGFARVEPGSAAGPRLHLDRPHVIPRPQRGVPPGVAEGFVAGVLQQTWRGMDVDFSQQIVNEFTESLSKCPREIMAMLLTLSRVLSTLPRATRKTLRRARSKGCTTTAGRRC